MNDPNECSGNCASRRGFLQTTGAGVATMMLGEVFPGRVLGQDADQPVRVSSFPMQPIAKLSELKANVPIEFVYPGEALHSMCLLIRLGRTAGGGVGPEQDIVAFSGRCTHMGGDLADGYAPEHKVLCCADHLTSFDLTRHGMLVAGHATQSLPQIVLELSDDDIFATAIVGLIYGYNATPTG